MRLIYAETLIEQAWKADTIIGRFNVVDVEDIEEAPTVDAVPVVRCKDCIKYYEVSGDTFGRCKQYSPNIPVAASHFCSYGERK